MSKRTDVMVDIETLGQGVDSTIFQIAAVAFDITSGEEYKTFNEVADISNRSLQVDGNTLKWWLKTDASLLNNLLNEQKGDKSPKEILGLFSEWLDGLAYNMKNVYLWGNGILFDNKMIQYQMEKNGYKYPIFYRNDRDVRTILELASIKEGVSEWDLRKKHENPSLAVHDAINDVRFQISLVAHCYTILTSNDELINL